MAVGLIRRYYVFYFSASEGSHGSCDDSFVYFDAPLNILFSLLFLSLLNKFLTFLFIAFPVAFPLIDRILFVDEMPSIKNADNFDLVVLEEIDELVDEEKEGCGLRFGMHEVGSVVAGAVDPTAHVDGRGVVAER